MGPRSHLARAALALVLGLGVATPASAGPPEDAAAPAPGPQPAAEPEAETLAPSAPPRDDAVGRIFNLPPAKKTDSYGPRPAGVKKLTRDQIVQFGLENPYVEAADDNIEAYEALLDKARFAWIPVIRTSASVSPGVNIVCDDLTLTQENGDPFNFQYCRPPDEDNDVQTISGYFDQLATAGVYVRLTADFVVPLYTFGKGINLKKMAKGGVAVAKLQKMATEQETVSRVYEAHAGLLLARESIRILDEAWDVVQGERVKIENDLGDDFDADPDEVNLDRDPDDMTRLEVGEIELAVLMREARKLESMALASLWAIAGPAAPEGFDIAETQLQLDTVEGGLDDVAEYRRRAMQNRPEARMADALVDVRKAQEGLARSNFLPNIGIAVRMNYGFANADGRNVPALYYTGRLNQSSIIASLAVQWNLDFHNKAFDLKRARAQKRQALHQSEAAKTLLGLEVETAYRDLTDASDDVQFMSIARDKSWQLVISQQQKASIGDADFKDLQKALRSWAEYQFKHFEAIQAHNVALAKLSRSVGEPLVGAPPPAKAADGEDVEAPGLAGRLGGGGLDARRSLDAGNPPIPPSRPLAGLTSGR